jgi:hypothetical protein
MVRVQSTVHPPRGVWTAWTHGLAYRKSMDSPWTAWTGGSLSGIGTGGSPISRDHAGRMADPERRAA